MHDPGLDRHEWESEMKDVGPGDVAAAINRYRVVHDSVIADRAAGEE